MTRKSWPEKRLRFIADINPSKSEVGSLGEDTLVSFLPMEAIGEKGELDLSRERRLADVTTGYTYFRNGDVAVAKITPCFENGKGALMEGLTNGFGFGTTELIVARPKLNEASSRFLFWLFSSPEFRKQGEGAMYGAGGQKRVPDEFVRDYRLPIPPLREQQAIATFLDRETAKIATLIAEQQQLIDLLSEKRLATIAHVVTKGLNLAVQMKETGLANLEEIPAHWEVVGFTKYLESVVDYRGRTPTKVDDGVLLITARNVKHGFIDYEASAEFISHEEYEQVMRRGAPKIGDVLFTTEAPLGQAANLDRTDIALAQRIIKFRGQEGILNNFFLKYWILGTYCQSELEQLATGSTALGIKGSKIGQLRLCLPPFAEQEAIVRYLDSTIARLDALVVEAEHVIALLQERRSALISATVTGKIDVRSMIAVEAV